MAIFTTGGWGSVTAQRLMPAVIALLVGGLAWMSLGIGLCGPESALAAFATANAVAFGAFGWWHARSLDQREARARSAVEAVQGRNLDLERRLVGWATQLEGLKEALVFEAAQRKQAQEILRESQERYCLLFERNPHPMWVIDLQSLSFLEVNEAALRHYGYTREEFLSMTIKDIRPSEDIPRLDAALAMAPTLPNEPMAWRHRRKDGTLIDVEVTWKSTTWSGRPALLVFAHDLTQRKQAERAMQMAEAKFRLFFENSVEGIFQATEDGHLLTANAALAQICGYESADKLIRNVTDFGELLCIDQKNRIKLAHLLRESDPLKGFEAQLIRKDKIPIWVSINARAARDHSGKLAYYEGTVQDISERKRAEDALRLLSGRLLQLQDEERRHIARELHDSTAQNLAMLAMELARVKHSSSKLNPRGRAALSTGLELAEQSGREIRTLSYLLHPPLLDERGLAAALRWYVDGFTQRSRIRVSLELPARLGRLPREVETTLFRIVQESLTNVHRHSGSPSATIRVLRDSCKVALEVRDWGRGIPPKTYRNVTEGVLSLGVGIAGMRERVKQLGGQLRICSGEEGTIVKATLPVQRGGR